MGNCIVIQKNQSASELQWSPIKESILDSQLSLKPQSPAMAHVASFQEFSRSKDEIFFDASVLMDSDCDDFFSVNGGTPSRGTTPVHPNSCTEAPPRLDKSLYVVDTSTSIPEPSPAGMKQLIEFFRESFSGEMADRDQYLQGFMEAKPTSFDPPPKHTDQSPQKPSASPASNVESTPGRGLHLRKQKSPRSAQCCLPSLVRSLSISDRKKRPSSTDSGCG